jgi:S-(hydroxymethyl)glutathione dehydrogenase/alcohol dehydrogenase
MKTRAAVMAASGGDWEIRELDLIEPRAGEVLVRNHFAGLCHSEEHIRYQGESGVYPIVGGHEGAGVVEAIGPGVTRVAVGDHVVCSFLPVCGICRYCASGRSYLCDSGLYIGTGQLRDGEYALSDEHGPIGAFCVLGTFADRMTVSQESLVRIDPDIPLDIAALVSCGVPTGWGSAVNAAEVRPGDTVVIFGSGGIGINAVQGAKHAGASAIIVVDPVESKRTFAEELGATHTTADPVQAGEWARELSAGTGADAVILTVGALDAATVGAAVGCVGKGGRILVTALADDPGQLNVVLPGGFLTYYGIRVQGVLFGQCNPQSDIPKLLKLWQRGELELDRLITKRYTLDEVNEGYVDQQAGRIIRGVVDLVG